MHLSQPPHGAEPRFNRQPGFPNTGGSSAAAGQPTRLSALLRRHGSGFRSLTPGSAPLVNTTPAASSAARIAATSATIKKHLTATKGFVRLVVLQICESLFDIGRNGPDRLDKARADRTCFADSKVGANDV